MSINAGPFENADFKAAALFLYVKPLGLPIHETKLRNEIWKHERRTE